MNSRTHKAKLNVISSLISQMVTIICGLIVPRALLGAFGSEAYGACASITQFLAYITLLEGGISGVARAALYKPLAENDTIKISQIVEQIKRFFRVIGGIFVAYVVLLAISFQNIAHSDAFDWMFTALLVVVISISTFVQYFLGISYTVLIQASQRLYVTYGISMISTVLNALLVLGLIRWNCDLIFVKLVSSCVFSMKPIVLWLYAKKKFQLKIVQETGEDMLSQRWTGLGQHIAYFLHSNTDIAVLTIFADLKLVAVYSVYHLVVSSIKTLTTSFSSGMEAVFGDMLAKNEKNALDHAFNLYESLVSVISIVLFGTTIALIVPFVKLYTMNVNDANYIQPLFAIILSLAAFLFCVRQPYHSMIIAAGHFKQTRVAAYGEALINIVISIMLTCIFESLIGVALGTVIAALFRFIYYVIYLEKNICYRRNIFFVKRCVVNISCLVMSILCGNLICVIVEAESYLKWTLCAGMTVFSASLITSIIYAIFYHTEFLALIKKVVGK